MSESSPARPRQVTLAAWLIMVGSVIVVAMVFDQIAGLHTIETRESVKKFLAEPPGADMGVGVDGVIALLRTFAMVAAGCATAAAILGYQVLRRSRSARFALTVLAVPLFLTGMVTGGFVSSVVAASAAMLWLQPARDWFNGITAPRPEARAVSTAPVAPTAHPAWPAPYGAAASPLSRPAPVLWACVVTWIVSSIAALGMVAAAIALTVDSDQLLAQARERNPDLAAQGVSDNVLLGATYTLVGVLVLWCIAAIVLAVLVFHRIEWARIVLIVFAATAGLLSLAGTVVGAFLLALPLVGATATVALLIRSDVRPWFQDRRDTP